MTDRVMTWAGLLAKWTEFAQSAAALPKSGEGARMRACVPAIIGLQAITHALAELDEVPVEEYGVGQDRAEIVIRRHVEEIHGAWQGEPLPEALREIISDARLALLATRGAGVEWRVQNGPMVADHPAEFGMSLIAGGFAGDLYLPAPGVPLFDGCPAGFLKTPNGGVPDPRLAAGVTRFLAHAAPPVRVRFMRQAYRQFDFGTGLVRRDYVVPMNGELPGGQPLLVPVIIGGELQAVPMPPPPGFAPDSVRVIFEEGTA